jgi:hypothetical protein
VSAFGGCVIQDVVDSLVVFRARKMKDVAFVSRGVSMSEVADRWLSFFLQCH